MDLSKNFSWKLCVWLESINLIFYETTVYNNSKFQTTDFLTKSDMRLYKITLCHPLLNDPTTKRKICKNVFINMSFSFYKCAELTSDLKDLLLQTFWNDDKTDLSDTNLYMKGIFQDKANYMKMKNWNISIPWTLSPLMLQFFRLYLQHLQIT